MSFVIKSVYRPTFRCRM